MPGVVDIEQAVLLLEVEPPFDKRDIQLARRRLAKQWHPDIAPPGKQLEHERHLKAVNEAADQLSRLAEESRGGKVSRNAVKVAGQAARKRRAEEGARAYEEEQRRRAQAEDQRKHDPFASRVPDHSVVHRYARCLSYPEWGVGSVNGIYFTGEDDDIQQWARVSFQVGVRTVPAGSLQFVDFHKPDPGAERVQRFMTAAKHALAEGDFKLAARRLVYARDAEPRNLVGAAAARRPPTGRPATSRPRRAPCATGSARSPAAPRRTGPPRASTRTWARSRRRSTRPSRSAPPRRRTPRPGSGSAGCGCAPSTARARARRSSGRARSAPPSRACSTSRSWRTSPATSAPRSRACEQATRLAPDSPVAWARYAHALARTDRLSDCLAACERALELADDPEVRDLREQVLAAAPRELDARLGARRQATPLTAAPRGARRRWW